MLGQQKEGCVRGLASSCSGEEFRWRFFAKIGPKMGQNRRKGDFVILSFLKSG